MFLCLFRAQTMLRLVTFLFMMWKFCPPLRNTQLPEGGNGFLSGGTSSILRKGETLHALNPNQPDTACIAGGILVPGELFWWRSHHVKWMAKPWGIFDLTWLVYPPFLRSRCQNNTAFPRLSRQLRRLSLTVLIKKDNEETLNYKSTF